LVYYGIKLLITTVLIVVISEIAKRNSFLAAVLASIPLVSVLAMVWLYVDTRDIERVSALSSGIFWLVLPSLVLFVVLPVLLKAGINFYLSLGLSVAVTTISYFLMISVLNHFGIKF